MARIKFAYIGGGSTRAPGTMASFIEQGENFSGSEVVLVDLDEHRLHIVRTLAEKMARTKGVDLTFSTTTNRREALRDCDAVLSSFRPGGFEARYLDERISLDHGVIGQETQGPGGFFMALRTVHVMQQIVSDMEEICPSARLFNYTNPVNVVAEAITHHSAIETVSLCEGPIIFPRMIARAAGLDVNMLDTTMIGLNHNCWTTRHLYQGQDIIPVLREVYERENLHRTMNMQDYRMLKLAVMMESLPSAYFQYYYYKEDVLSELLAKDTTRAQDIMAAVPDYWRHYEEQAQADVPVLDPKRSRGGINELELAFDVMDAVYNDKGEIWTTNVPNRGAISDFPDDLVVEVPSYVDRHGVTPLVQGQMPRQTVGLIKMLGEYQALAAEAAWCGTRSQAIRALASHPLVFSIEKAEAIYDDLASRLKDYLPDRLFHG